MSPPIAETFAAALSNHRAGRWVEASQLYRQILAADPSHADALAQLGSLALTAGNPALALQLFQQAVAVQPNSPATWNHLGHYHRAMANPAEAQVAFEHAISLDHNFAPAHSNLGSALQDQGQIDRAIASFEQALQLAPDSAEIHSNLVYATCFSENFSAQQQLAAARGWADRHQRPALPLEIDHDPSRKLKIGYVSPDFRQHVVGRNVLPILEHHDRDRFEIHCFFTNATADSLTPRFAAASTCWHSCGSVDADELAELIRAQRIDILVDLSVHLAGNRLSTFARKPAPVQITWAGYPGTTGLSTMDYRLTDPYLDPPGAGDDLYSETSIRLPHSFWCYRPIAGTPDVESAPDTYSVTFGCLNHFAKVNEITLNLWANVLQQVPSSRLILLCPSGPARSNVLTIFLKHHVSPDRITFVDIVPPDQHMPRYHPINIALDPVGYTGHTTTLDALWMGVPVITLPGPTCACRGSVTALTHAGLCDLIAATPRKYIQIAVDLARDRTRLHHLRATLRAKLAASPICEEPRFTANIESAYRCVWEIHCQSSKR